MKQKIVIYNEQADKFVSVTVGQLLDKEQVIKDIPQLQELDLSYTVEQNVEKEIVKVLTTDTFSVIIADDRVKSLTYNEWESYRVGQAYAGIENLLSNQSEKIKVLFKQFTQDMQDKYAGQASWVKIYNNLIENIKEG